MNEVTELIKSLVPNRTEVAVGGTTGMFGALVTILYGEWTQALNALLIAMAIDYLTGVLAAAVSPDEAVDYEKGAKGLAKKVTILLIVALGHLADAILGANVVCLAVTYGYLANEGISIVRNAETIGVPVPDIVKMAYRTIGEKGSSSLNGKKTRRG